MLLLLLQQRSMKKAPPRQFLLTSKRPPKPVSVGRPVCASLRSNSRKVRCPLPEMFRLVETWRVSPFADPWEPVVTDHFVPPRRMISSPPPSIPHFWLYSGIFMLTMIQPHFIAVNHLSCCYFPILCASEFGLYTHTVSLSDMATVCLVGYATD